jgi:DNA-directed RNA polymerase subunit RPC12/RpoP
MKTAEWLCQSCGATNRRLVPEDQKQAVDRCLTCHTRHLIVENQRPVRWDATVKR